MIGTNKNATGIKGMKLSKALLKMWLCMVAVSVFISATSEESVFAFVAVLVIVSAVGIAALYCTVVLDIGINTNAMFKMIHIITGTLLALLLAVYLSMDGILVFELSLNYAARLAMLFAATIFITRVGAQVLIAGAYAIADNVGIGE